jgi:hypothetical protein
MDVGVSLYREESLEAFEAQDGRVSGCCHRQAHAPCRPCHPGHGGQTQLRTLPKKQAFLSASRIPSRWTGACKRRWKVSGLPGTAPSAITWCASSPFYIALGTVANKMGRIAGLNIGGETAEFPGVVGTAVSKICEVEVARSGLMEKEAQELELNYAAETIETSTRAGYYPDSGPITVKMLGEKGKRASSRRSDRGQGRGGKAHRCDCHSAPCRYDGGRNDSPGPELCAPLCSGLGPDSYCRPGSYEETLV